LTDLLTVREEVLVLDAHIYLTWSYAFESTTLSYK